MSKHSEGPWRVLPLDGKYYGTQVEVGDGLITVWTPNHYACPFASSREIALGWQPEDGHDHIEDVQSYANACLIAAAPDLLAALTDVIGWVPMGEAWHTDEADRAVKRAREAIAKANGSDA